MKSIERQEKQLLKNSFLILACEDYDLHSSAPCSAQRIVIAGKQTYLSNSTSNTQ
jgi:hypothetical protein